MTTTLEIADLSVALPPGSDRPFALENVSLRLEPGRVLCIVGESGSGKSMMASAIMRLLPDGVRVTNGQVRLGEQEDLLTLPEPDMRRVRGARVAMIFQEPMTALNPLRTIGDQVEECFRIHRPDLGPAERRDRALASLDEVRLPDPASALRAYPHELSGGQRQRAMIAMAMALEPEVLIADEPTTALDVTTQAQILQLIRDLQTRRGTTVLFITHDFGVVAEIADTVAVMKDGEVVEQGDVDAVLTRPQHEYTRELIAAVPSPTLAANRPPAPPAAPVLTVSNLVKTYGGRGLFRRRPLVRALDDVSISLPRGQTLGIVGESGSGKSTLARCIMRLIKPDSGSVMLNGIDLATLSPRRLRQKTKLIQMVFQDPNASLNPRRRVGDLVAQGPLVHGVGQAEVRARVRDLFELVGLRPEMADRFPHEFSGGQRQRISLARALALWPDVVVADEAVSALDVSVQARVLRLLADLRRQRGLSVLFITHDLRVAAQVSDRIVVMHRGRVVEEGPVASVFGDPQHEYTRALLAALPGRHRQVAAGIVPG